MPTAEEVIVALGLQPLDGEGGYFRQTWILPSEHGAPQATAIMYLITPDSFSALHRLDADEVFHFYLGDPCQQIVINHEDNVTPTILGSNVLASELVQTVVPKGCWQGTRLLAGGSWALLGTTMTPGFHLDGFELASSTDLNHMPVETRSLAATYLADRA